MIRILLFSIVFFLPSCTSRTDTIIGEQQKLKDSIDEYKGVSWEANHESQYIMKTYEDTILTDQQVKTIDSLITIMGEADSAAYKLTLQYDSLEREPDKIKKR